MAVNSIFVFSIVFLLLITLQTAPSFSKNVLTEDNGQEQEADKDLSLLEDETEVVLSDEDPFSNFHNYENYDDLEDDVAADDSFNDESYMPPEVDEKDVLVLKESNFSEFIRKNKHVMVEFYAPWCGHCQALVPEYATAATELKKEDVVLAKVDATEEAELAQKYDVQGFPTVYFFVNGIHKQYPGQRSKDAIVTWVKKKIGPSLHNITTIEEAEHILATEPKVVLCYLDALVGSDSDELSAVSSLEDDVNFYQTNSPDVAKLFHIDPLAKRPALVLIKQEDEKVSHFDDQFSKSAISEFVYKNKLPLVTHFTREGAPQIFDNPIKNQVILFAGSHDSETLLPIFQEAAKAFKGKLLFVYVESDNEDVGKPVSEYFGVKEGATSVLAYTGNEDARKFLMDGDFSVSNIKSFGEKFLEDNLKPFYKSDPIPEKNDGDVKVVVGNNFDEIVLDESKDVLLEIYDPSCGHCKSLEPIYNKLGRYLRGIDSLIIAKMDGTTNEHPRAKQDGFPTLLFFPAGNKSFDPITVDTDRTVVDFYKFLKKHATIPFKLKKPASYDASKASESSSKQEEGIDNEVKDEL